MPRNEHTVPLRAERLRTDGTCGKNAHKRDRIASFPRHDMLSPVPTWNDRRAILPSRRIVKRWYSQQSSQNRTPGRIHPCPATSNASDRLAPTEVPAAFLRETPSPPWKLTETVFAIVPRHVNLPPPGPGRWSRLPAQADCLRGPSPNSSRPILRCMLPLRAHLRKTRVHFNLPSGPMGARPTALTYSMNSLVSG